MQQSSKNVSHQKKKVLIVGCSFAGMTAMRMLHKQFNIFIVDTKDFFEYTPGIFNCFIRPSHLKNLTIPYSHFVKKFKCCFIHGKIISISEKEAQVQIGDDIQTIYFDFCLVSTGSMQNKPIKVDVNEFGTLSQRWVEIKQTNQKIINAQEILIVGGGTVGVELAATIAQIKRVTLIARHKILPSMPPKAQQLALDRLIGMGVIVAENTEEKQLKKQFDLIFYCIGNKFQIIDIRDLNKNRLPCNQLRVDDFCRVLKDDNFPYLNIFAAGDVALSSLKQEKTAFSAEIYGEVAASNIRYLGLNQQKRKMKKLYYLPKIYVIRLDKYYSILIFEQICFGGILGWLANEVIERTKMIQYRGNIMLEYLWDLIHIIFNIITAIYMFISLVFSGMPMKKQLKSSEKQDLQRLSKDIKKKIL